MNLVRGFLIALLLGTGTLSVAQPTPPDDVLMRALREEMARAMDELRLDDQPPPYFVAYEVVQFRSLAMEARGQALTRANHRHQRRLNVEVRVGSPEADSSRVLRMGGAIRMAILDQEGATALPLGEDYDALRRRIWLATDLAYKRALEDLAARKAAASTRETGERTPDLVPAPVLVASDDRGQAHLDLEDLPERLRAAAAVLSDMPAVEQSMLWLRVDEDQVWYLTSEGTATFRRHPSAHLGLAAATRASDGEPLSDYRQYRTLQASALPSRDALIDAARELGERLSALRQAESLGEFTGPVLFQGEAAAQLVAHRLANRLAPLPRHYAAELPMQSFADQLVDQTAGFSRRLGARVLPAGTQLIDDATLRQWQGRAIPGAVAFDSEGVAATRKVLVEDGRLQSLLSTRVPAVSGNLTPGNQRGAFPGVSTLHLHSADGLDAAAMQAQIKALLDEAGQPYALEIERFADAGIERRLNATSFSIFLAGSEAALPRPVRASKVWPDGRRTPVRGVVLADIGDREFRSLAGIGDAPFLHVQSPDEFSRMSFFSHRKASVLPSAYLVPPLLFEELSASEDSRQVRRLPLLPKPSASTAAQ